MLSQCTTWKSLTRAEADAAIAAVSALVPKIIAQGQLKEADIHEACGRVLQEGNERVLENTIYQQTKRKRKLKVLEERPLNHRRAVHISHAVIMRQRALAEGTASGTDDVSDDDDDEPLVKCVCCFFSLTHTIPASPF